MRALTVTQPWAGLLAAGIKRIENRPRTPPAHLLAEQFAIHASREFDQAAMRRVIEIDPRLALDHPESLTRRDRLFEQMTTTSCVVGVATLVTYVTDVRQIAEYTTHDQERWFFGPIGYVLRDAIALRDPVACKGMLGFWTLPEEVERKVRKQIAERAS